MRRVFLLLFFAGTFFNSYGQLWYEDFDESDGATSGVAGGTLGGPWTVTTTPSGGASRFAVNDGTFVINNTGSEATWSTGTIDIASVGYAVISVNINSFGLPFTDTDYVQLYYSLDGGPETLFSEFYGSFISSATSASAIVAANTLRIIIKGRDNTWLGGISFDNVTVTAAPIIYSRKSGSWTDNDATNGTWSLTSHTGSSCGCRPLNSQVVVIGNSHTVTLPSSHTAIGNPPTTNLAPGAVDILPTGTLQFVNNNATLGIVKGLVRVRSGGVINSSSAAITGEQIMFNANVGAANLQIDAGGSASIEDLVIGPNTTNSVYVMGGGDLTITDDILINADNSTLYNNLTGTFTVSDRLEFQTGVTDAQFVNNQPLTLGTIYFDEDDDVFTNNATATVGLLASGNGDDNGSIVNTAGATLNLGSVATQGQTDILNAGTINQTGNFTTIVAGSVFTNQSSGVWNWSLSPNAGFDTDINTVLRCTTAGNLFNYNGAGNQSILNLTYYHLTISNSGTKMPSATLDVNGNLLISNAATLSPSGTAIDVEGNVAIENSAVLGGTGNVAVGGNWSAVNATSFVQGTRLTTFDGAAQVINNASGTEGFYDFTIAGSNTTSSSNILDIDNNLLISGTAQLNVSADLTVGGNWTVSSTNGNPFVEGTHKVTFDGPGSQVINTSLATGETFYDLDITGPGTTSNTSRITILNDLTIAGTATTQLSGAGNISIGGDWNITNTLSANPFVEGTRTVSFIGSDVQTFSTTATGETFYSLLINNTSGTFPQVTFEKQVSVTNTLNLQNGVLDLSGTTLTLGSNTVASTLSRTNGWVYNGTFRRGWVAGTISSSNTNAYGLFPVGHAASGAYRPVQINSGTTMATRPSVGGYFTAQHINVEGVTELTAPITTDGAGVNFLVKHNSRFITTITGVSGGTYSINATMTGLLSTGSMTNIRLGVNTGTTTADKVGTHVNTTGSTASPVAARNAITTLAQFNNDFRIISTNTNTPLPIELVSFSARLNNDVVDLGWRTASELNNDFFTVERTADVEHFEPISQIDGAGTTNRPIDYAHTDTAPLYGRSYYRLKQTDFDGSYTYSKVVVVDYDGPRFASLHVYPNPLEGGNLDIVVRGLRDQHSVPVQIIDSRGLVVYEESFELESAAVFQRQLKLSLKPGIYIVRSGKTRALTQKLIIK